MPDEALPEGLSIGPMTRAEASTLVEWAADEGWNPGDADIGIAWDLDPAAFIALRRGDAFVGGGTIFRHDPHFGFMGLFIVRADLRQTGLGAPLWRRRLALLRERLAPGATIGMDGVYHMEPFYARGGFVPAHRHLRFQGIARGCADQAVHPLTEADFPAVAAFDREYFPASRTAFLHRWLFQPGGHARGFFRDGTLLGYGHARPAREGHHLGPVFATTPAVATRLVGELMLPINGQTVQLDIPEPNQEALRLAERLGLSETFGCVRMYHGPAPSPPLQQIYGVTSYEFG
jgi:Acetyltransferase (GNAT) domain